MKQQFTSIAIALALAGCGGSYSHESVTDDMARLSAEQAVRDRLNDPDSAIFSGVAVYRGSGMEAVCGNVRARNLLGGMAPAQRFIAGGETALESDFVSPEEFAVAWSTLCR